MAVAFFVVTNSEVYHLTDTSPDEAAWTTRCGRTFERHEAAAVHEEPIGFRPCTRCEAVTDG